MTKRDRVLIAFLFIGALGGWGYIGASVPKAHAQAGAPAGPSAPISTSGTGTFGDVYSHSPGATYTARIQTTGANTYFYGNDGSNGYLQWNGTIWNFNSSGVSAQNTISGGLVASATNGNVAFGLTNAGARFKWSGANTYIDDDGTTLTAHSPFKSTASYSLASVADSATAPTISSGFGTGASIVASNGTAAFQINVGTTSGNTGVIGLPTATTGWVCHCEDITTESTTVTYTKQTASTTTSCTVGNFTDIAGAGAWTNSDKLNCTARGY